MRSFTEQNPAVAAANKALTARAVAWAVAQMRRENASVRGVARQLRVAWRTVWTHVEAELQRREQDPGRFDGVEVLGVDEHIWHHVDPRERGPKELTGMVDLSRDEHGKTRASAARPGAWPLREGLCHLARRTRRSVPEEREGRRS